MSRVSQIIIGVVLLPFAPLLLVCGLTAGDEVAARPHHFYLLAAVVFVMSVALLHPRTGGAAGVLMLVGYFALRAYTHALARGWTATVLLPVAGVATMLLFGLAVIGFWWWRLRYERAAVQHVREGDPTAGVELLERRIEAGRGSAPLYATLAAVLIGLKRYDDALARIADAERAGFHTSALRLYKAMALWKGKGALTAIPVLEEATARDPLDFNSAVLLGELYAELSRWPDAAGQLQQVEQLGRRTLVIGAAVRASRREAVARLRDAIPPDQRDAVPPPRPQIVRPAAAATPLSGGSFDLATMTFVGWLLLLSAFVLTGGLAVVYVLWVEPTGLFKDRWLRLIPYAVGTVVVMGYFRFGWWALRRLGVRLIRDKD
ncbi:MAG: hypothetical protein U0736_03005 [Gemmataceae bacterium]